MKMAEKLKLARKNAKLTQEQVGQVFNIKRASVSLWESSQPKSTKPNIRKLAKLAELYKVSVKDLLEDDVEDDDLLLTEISDYVHLLGQRDKELILNLCKYMASISKDSKPSD